MPAGPCERRTGRGALRRCEARGSGPGAGGHGHTDLSLLLPSLAGHLPCCPHSAHYLPPHAAPAFLRVLPPPHPTPAPGPRPALCTYRSLKSYCIPTRRAAQPASPGRNSVGGEQRHRGNVDKMKLRYNLQPPNEYLRPAVWGSSRSQSSC